MSEGTGRTHDRLLNTTDILDWPPRRTLPAEPLTITISEASRITGFSRSEIYRRLAKKEIRAVKSGSRTLILMDSLRQHLESLPPATFKAPAASD